MKTVYKMLLVLVLGIGLVTALYLLRPQPDRNGFKRGQIFVARQLHALELKYNFFYIDQLDSTRIYLRNYKALLAQFSCRHDLSDSLYEKIAYSGERKRILDLLKKRIVQQTDPLGDSFGTDGFLSINEAKEKLLYTYYYRNSFVCLDAGLNVLYKARMIDTNTVAKIALGSFREGDKQIRTMAKPALAVNKRGYSDGIWFYNHSALAADNESLKAFKKHEVFDVYRLADGLYSYSVYVPKYLGLKLSDFAVQGDLLVALYGKYLVVYSLERKEVF